MKKLGKILLFILGLLVILLIAVYFSLGMIVKKVVTGVVPSLTQTTATIDNVDLSLFSGRIAFSDFSIGNPTGFSDQNAFQIKNVLIEFDPKSILTNTIVVNKVSVDGTQITAELNQKGDINLNTLYQNINAFTNKGTATPETAKTETPATQSTQSGKGVSLKQLSVTDSAINLVVLKQSMQIPLPNINYVDQGKRRSISETIALIVNKITKESLTAVQKSGQELINKQLKNIQKATQEAAQKQLDNIKNQAAESLSEGVSGLKNLFK